MNVWLIQIGESLPLTVGRKKLRTALLADTLVSRGHSVLWWASAFDHFDKNWVFTADKLIEIGDKIKIFALKGKGYKRNVSLTRFIDHRTIAKKFKEKACDFSLPDIMIVSMPSHDLAYEAVRFANKNKIPVIVDIRDPWPDIFLDFVPESYKFLAKKLLHRDFNMIKDVMTGADGLVGVTNTFLEWGLKYAERSFGEKDRVFYLGAEKMCEEAREAENLATKYNLKGRFVVTFIGTFARYHDPSILIDCAKKMEDKNITFMLAGDGELYGEIYKMADQCVNVNLMGWLNRKEINALLKVSDVGICPTGQNIDLFPNKAFSYFSAGLPIVSAFQGDIKAVCEKYKVGLYYEPKDIDMLVKNIELLYDERSLYNQMTENVRELFVKTFDAGKIYEKYADYIEGVASGCRRKG
jgi:glycosyltransferase involved in cell wall biosynthesis